MKQMMRKKMQGSCVTKTGFCLLFFYKMQLQLMHDFWRVSANVILYLCMRNASISIVSFSKKKNFLKNTEEVQVETKKNCWLFLSLLIVAELNTALLYLFRYYFIFTFCVLLSQKKNFFFVQCCIQE